MMWIWFIVSGLLSGVVAGMGMGGGTILIPVLTIFFSVTQVMSQGINLLAFLPCAIVSLIIHIKSKLVNFKIGLPIILAGVLASVAASFLAVNTKNDTLQLFFAVFLLCVGLEQIVAVVVQIVKNKYSLKRKVLKKIVFKESLK